MELMEIASVPVITAIVYGAMSLYKYAVGDNEKLIRIIPILAVLLGVLLGIIVFYAMGSLIPADNVLTAILIGGASGLAATGTNQIWKQLTKGKDENTEATDNDKSGE